MRSRHLANQTELSGMPGEVDLEVIELLQDEPELLAIADAVATTYKPGVASVRVRQRRLLLAAAVAAAAVLIPSAYALVRHFGDFVSSPPAPRPAVARFNALRLSSTKEMDPQVLASQARIVHTFRLDDGSSVQLSVAPTKRGGFCEAFSGFTEICDADRSNPFGVGLAGQRLPEGGPAVVSGYILSAEASQVEVQLRDGEKLRVPLIRVSAPIKAAFFFREIPLTNQPVEARALDSRGAVLATRQIAVKLPRFGR